MKTDPGIFDRDRKVLLKYMEEHQIDTTGTNYDLTKRILLHFFPSGIQNQIVISNIELKTYTSDDEKIGRWLVGPKINRSELVGQVIIYFQCGRYYDRIYVNRIIAKYENISKYDLVTSCLIEIEGRGLNDSSTISNLLQIPQRRKQVSERTDEWSEFLDWQEKYVLKNQFSALVLRSTYDLDNGLIEVDVAIENEFEAKLKILKRDTSMIWVKGEISSFERRFVPDTRKRYDTNSVGTISKKHIKQRRNRYDKDDLDREEEPYKIFIDLNDDLINRMSRSEIPERYLPQSGDFLLNAVGGDLAPIRNQKIAINRLINQEMINFNLGDFIFNYSEASATVNIQSELPYDPLEQNINDKQKKALLKILSAEDVALVQGPPGTGKTTIIAELCYQLAKQGKRILVSSQTNLAVDNALTRLQNKEEILPIRLGYATEDGQQFVEENVVDYWFNSVEENVKSRVQMESEIKSKYDKSVKLIDNINKILLELSILREKNIEILDDIKTEQESISEIEEPIGDLSKQIQDNNINKLILQNLNDPSNNLEFRNFITNHEELITGIENLIQLKQYKSFHNLDCIDLYIISNRSKSLIQEKDNLENIVQKLKKLSGGLTEIASKEIDELSLEREKLKSATTEDELEKLLIVNKKIAEIKSHQVGFDQNEWFDLIEMATRIVKPHAFLRDLFGNLESSLKPDENTLQIILQIEEALKDHIDLIKKSPSMETKVNEKISHQLTRLDQEIQKLNIEINQYRGSIQKFQRNLDLLESKLSSNQSQEVKLDSERIDLVSKIKNYTTLAIEIHNIEINQLKASVEQWYRDNISKYNISRSWMNFREKWVEKIKNRSKKDLDDLTSVYVDAANVVGATCYYTGQRKFFENSQKFDFVIIDEVSKATAPELLMPMLLGEKIVLVGDHRQLPPLFQEKKSFKESDDPHAEETLSKYEKLVTTSYFEDAWIDIPGSLKERLNDQYRMHESIMRAVNQFYQDDPLRLGTPDLNLLKRHNLTIPGFLSSNSNLIWIDSTYSIANGKKIRNYAEKPNNSTSRFNQLELDIIKNLLKLLNRAGKELKVGIITFYGAQVKKIKDMVNSMRKNLENLELTHGTVDRFQGAEREIIIVSFVGAVKHGKVTTFVRDFRRVNVAISRAQKLLIVIGAAEDFKNAKIDLQEIGGSRSSQPYQTIIDLVKQNNGFFDAQEILKLNSKTGRN